MFNFISTLFDTAKPLLSGVETGAQRRARQDQEYQDAVNAQKRQERNKNIMAFALVAVALVGIYFIAKK